MRGADNIKTPAFVVELARLVVNVKRIRALVMGTGCRVLFSLKALELGDALVAVAPFVDGFSASSLFEALHAREIGGDSAIVSYVSSIIRSHELDAIVAACDHVTLNSLTQLDRFKHRLLTKCEIGVRINPGVSFADDSRYDPCRPGSRLGVPLTTLRDNLVAGANCLSNVVGLHFHSNCDSENGRQLITTLHRIEAVLGDYLRHFRWLNVGGGYSFQDDSGLDELASEFRRFDEQYGLQLIMEPGAAIARSAGSLFTTVEDIVEGSEYPTAILDTTVNHWPEVFEYQFEPDVVGHIDDGDYTYQLAGCSCLAGDLFGVYSFNEALKVGSRIVFLGAGAYSIVKSHMFNGINLPHIYAMTEAGQLVLAKSFSYADFSSRWGVDTHAVV